MEDCLEGRDFTEAFSVKEAEEDEEEEEEEDFLDGIDLISSLTMTELRLGWDLCVLMVL